MNFLLRPVQWIYVLYAAILFAGIMLLIFPFVLIASFFGKIRGGNMILIICRFWGWTWFPLVGIINRKIYEVPHDKRKAYIFLSNHISFLDAAIIPSVYSQPVRALGKVEMGNIPIFGFIYKRAIVSVDRTSIANRSKSVRILKSMLNKGISVIVFPEGTFNMGTTPLKEFYDGAFRIAIETQTPLKPVLFLDTYRRMPHDSIFKLSPGINRLLFLEEIPVSGYTAADTKRLKEEVYDIMEKKLIEYKAAWKNNGNVR